MLRLFIEDIEGYVNTYDSVYSVNILKIESKNNLKIKYDKNDKDYDVCIPLKDIRLCYLVDIETMHEYFRYEK